MQELIRPAQLNPGDRIAALTHSWGGPGAFPYRYEMGKARIEALFNLRVMSTKHALKDPEWLDQHPEARAQDLMDAFSDPTIKGIFSTIGGNDAIRLLPYVDFEIIRKNPKVFLGFSDATVIHFMCLKAGLGSFYGPAIMTSFAENMCMNDYTIKGLEKALFSDEYIGGWPWNRGGWTKQYLEWENPENQYIQRKYNPVFGWHFHGQKRKNVEGRLIGGCVETLETLMGTSLWPDLDVWDDCILFLETSELGMLPEALERFLRKLADQGILKKLKGILFSKPGGPDIKGDKFGLYDKVFRDIIEGYSLGHLTVVTIMDFGHSEPQWTLPYGCLVEINPVKNVVFFKENGVDSGEEWKYR